MQVTVNIETETLVKIYVLAAAIALTGLIIRSVR